MDVLVFLSMFDTIQLSKSSSSDPNSTFAIFMRSHFQSLQVPGEFFLMTSVKFQKYFQEVLAFST